MTKDFDKRFDEAMKARRKFLLASTVGTKEVYSFEGGANWTKPSLKAAYEALDVAECDCQDANHETGLMCSIKCSRCVAWGEIEKLLGETDV